MYQVLLFKFRRHLCKGSMLVSWESLLGDACAYVVVKTRLNFSQKANLSEGAAIKWF